MKRTVGIRHLLIVVAVIAAGLASMRVATDLMVKAAVTVVPFVFFASLVGAIVRKSAAWIGFTVFFLGYFLYSALLANSSTNAMELTSVAVSAIAARFYPESLEEPSLPKVNEIYLAGYKGLLEVRKLRKSGDAESNMRFDSIDISLLTKEEMALMSAYEDACTARDLRNAKAQKLRGNAESLGYLEMMLLYGVIGAGVGKVLQIEPESQLTSLPAQGD